MTTHSAWTSPRGPPASPDLVSSSSSSSCPSRRVEMMSPATVRPFRSTTFRHRFCPPPVRHFVLLRVLHGRIRVEVRGTGASPLSPPSSVVVVVVLMDVRVRSKGRFGLDVTHSQRDEFMPRLWADGTFGTTNAPNMSRRKVLFDNERHVKTEPLSVHEPSDGILPPSDTISHCRFDAPSPCFPSSSSSSCPIQRCVSPRAHGPKTPPCYPAVHIVTLQGCE